MTAKLMIYIDGSWLFHNLSYLRNAFGDPEYVIDYKKFPGIIAQYIENIVKIPVDVARTHFFGAIPLNKPGFDPVPQQNFFDFLEKECHYSMEIYDIDFKGNAERYTQEKCVDIALATSMMMNALIPGSFDIAALVAGDLDYLPLLKRVRLLGKRTQLIAMKAIDNYSPSSEKLVNNYSLFDFPVFYLDDHIEELRLVREKKLRVCDSCREKQFTTWDGPNFLCPACLADRQLSRNRVCKACGSEQDTSWKGENFYCTDCREKHKMGKW
jgi:uncharacterized LabA/DUF88 family protein